MKSVVALALVATTLSSVAAMTAVQSTRPTDVAACTASRVTNWNNNPGRLCNTTIEFNVNSTGQLWSRFYFPDEATLPKFCANADCRATVANSLLVRPTVPIANSNVLDCFTNPSVPTGTEPRFVYFFKDLIDPLAAACNIEAPPTTAPPTTQPPATTTPAPATTTPAPATTTPAPATTTPAPSTKTPCPLPQPPEPTTGRPAC